MLDARETNILRHVLATRPGAVAERLARRIGSDPVDPSAIPPDERREGAEALAAYAATNQSFGVIALDAARQLRAAG